MVKAVNQKGKLCPQCGTVVSPEQKQRGICSNCEFPLMVVAGKYRLQKTLDEGNMGRVYLAHHILLESDRDRVVKVMKPDVMGRPGMVERFFREVRVTAALSQRNEHIVKIYDDFGEEPWLGYYYVMEYLAGKQLKKMLRPGQMLEQELVFHIFSQLCQAMRAAHLEGVVHRDLKPENIFLIQRDNDPYFVKVIDFGIARPLKRLIHTDLTQGAIGTPDYMAPEQCLNEPVDNRCDIYAMGVLLYELLTGTTPFAHLGKDVLVTMHAQVAAAPEPMRKRRADLDIHPGLDEAVLCALEKDPDDRFPTVEDFWEALSDYLPEISDPEVIAEIARKRGTVDMQNANFRSNASWRRRSHVFSNPLFRSAGDESQAVHQEERTDSNPMPEEFGLDTEEARWDEVGTEKKANPLLEEVPTTLLDVSSEDEERTNSSIQTVSKLVVPSEVYGTDEQESMSVLPLGDEEEFEAAETLLQELTSEPEERLSSLEESDVVDASILEVPTSRIPAVPGLLKKKEKAVLTPVKPAPQGVSLQEDPMEETLDSFSYDLHNHLTELEEGLFAQSYKERMVEESEQELVEEADLDLFASVTTRLVLEDLEEEKGSEEETLDEVLPKEQQFVSAPVLVEEEREKVFSKESFDEMFATSLSADDELFQDLEEDESEEFDPEIEAALQVLTPNDSGELEAPSKESLKPLTLETPVPPTQSLRGVTASLLEEPQLSSEAQAAESGHISSIPKTPESSESLEFGQRPGTLHLTEEDLVSGGMELVGAPMGRGESSFVAESEPDDFLPADETRRTRDKLAFSFQSSKVKEKEAPYSYKEEPHAFFRSPFTLEEEAEELSEDDLLPVEEDEHALFEEESITEQTRTSEPAVGSLTSALVPSNGEDRGANKLVSAYNVGEFDETYRSEYAGPGQDRVASAEENLIPDDIKTTVRKERGRLQLGVGDSDGLPVARSTLEYEARAIRAEANSIFQERELIRGERDLGQAAEGDDFYATQAMQKEEIAASFAVETVVQTQVELDQVNNQGRDAPLSEPKFPRRRRRSEESILVEVGKKKKKSRQGSFELSPDLLDEDDFFGVPTLVQAVDSDVRFFDGEDSQDRTPPTLSRKNGVRGSAPLGLLDADEGEELSEGALITFRGPGEVRASSEFASISVEERPPPKLSPSASLHGDFSGIAPPAEAEDLFEQEFEVDLEDDDEAPTLIMPKDELEAEPPSEEEQVQVHSYSGGTSGPKVVAKSAAGAIRLAPPQEHVMTSPSAVAVSPQPVRPKFSGTLTSLDGGKTGPLLLGLYLLFAVGLLIAVLLYSFGFPKRNVNPPIGTTPILGAHTTPQVRTVPLNQGLPQQPRRAESEGDASSDSPKETKVPQRIVPKASVSPAPAARKVDAPAKTKPVVPRSVENPAEARRRRAQQRAKRLEALRTECNRLYFQNAYARAASCYRRLLKKEPKNTSSYVYMGLLNFRLGACRKARSRGSEFCALSKSYFRRYLRTNPRGSMNRKVRYLLQQLERPVSARRAAPARRRIAPVRRVPARRPVLRARPRPRPPARRPASSRKEKLNKLNDMLLGP